MTLIGNRPEWVYAMVACFRIGAVALPCTEQLRPADLRARMEAVDPRLVVADERNLETIEATGFDGPVLAIPDERLFDADPAPAVDLEPTDPCLITFTSGTSGEPKPIRHGQRYLPGQQVQAEHWFGARPGDLTWCTAASGWSKSARNVFIAPWVRGAAALLHDARFDPEERLRDHRARAGRRAVHGADRVPGDRQAHGAAAAALPAPRRGRRRAAQPRDRRDLAGRGRHRASTTATARPRPAR